MEPNMIPDRDQSLPRRPRRNRVLKGVPAVAPAVALAAVVTLAMLGGCSAVPEWADPTDWFATDPAPTTVGLAEGQARSQPTAFPNLASVPNQPPKVLSLEARAEVQAGLAADRAHAVYSGEKLTGATPILADATRTAATRTAGAPPAPRISNEFTAELRVPSAPVRTQVAQTPVAQTPVAPAPVAQTLVAQASGGRTPLRFPQFQNLQPQVAVSPAFGVELVAVIYFGHSSSRLDGDDRAVLRDVVALRRQSGRTIRVVGHASALTAVTDQITHDLSNFEMSLKRANTVVAELIALGAARDRVRAEARGDRQPVYHEFMSTGEAGNRRVEIFLEN